MSRRERWRLHIYPAALKTGVRLKDPSSKTWLPFADSHWATRNESMGSKMNQRGVGSGLRPLKPPTCCGHWRETRPRFLVRLGCRHKVADRKRDQSCRLHWLGCGGFGGDEIAQCESAVAAIIVAPFGCVYRREEGHDSPMLNPRQPIRSLSNSTPRNRRSCATRDRCSSRHLTSSCITCAGWTTESPRTSTTRGAGEFGAKLCEQALETPGVGEAFAVSVRVIEDRDDNSTRQALHAGRGGGRGRAG